MTFIGGAATGEASSSAGNTAAKPNWNRADTWCELFLASLHSMINCDGDRRTLLTQDAVNRRNAPHSPHPKEPPESSRKALGTWLV